MKMNLDEVFNKKINENGDMSFISTSNHLLDILFLCEYFQNHLDQVQIMNSEKEKLFSMFIRDPRYGLGYRDLGRVLMDKSGVSLDYKVKAGRFDDLFFNHEKMSDDEFSEVAAYLHAKIADGNELAKKWMPRYSSKNLMLARRFAKVFGMNKQTYGHFIKANTVENSLSRKEASTINFAHVPSNALLKYYKRFKDGADTSEAFAKYLESVKKGKCKMNTSTMNVYDIFRNRENVDCDLLFSKLEKISGNWIPIVDTSGSMLNNDAMGKAMSIGHYLAKCSTYAPNKVVTFSSKPQLVELGVPAKRAELQHILDCNPIKNIGDSQYLKEIDSMFTGDWSNTDFGAVMELLKEMTDMPEYLIVLSDMEFDRGSKLKKDELELLWKERGYTTKIIWWNFNGRNKTVPEVDKNGNIYISGYSPMLLKYLETGFDGERFLEALLSAYAEKIS